MGELSAKLTQGIQARGYDVIVAVGPDNFTYVTGAVAPFGMKYPDRLAIVVRPRQGPGVAICPVEWAEAIKSQGWTESVMTYDENESMPPRPAVTLLASALGELGVRSGRIGLDMARASRRFVELLSQLLPGADLVACDDLLRELRLIKTQAERELLAIAAQQAERGIVGALNHIEGAFDAPGGIGYTVGECSQRIRVHISDLGASHVGHLATMRGPYAHLVYAPQRGDDRLLKGDLVRMDVTYHCRGYWANAGRMVVIGEPTQEQRKSYEENLALKAAGEKMLKPGMPCSDVFRKVQARAAQDEINLWAEPGIGHGIGVSCEEGPHLNPYDHTVLAPGMVLALDIYTLSPRGELIHSKDTYEIVEDGHNLLSWYRKWNRLYAVTGVQAVTPD